MVRYYDRCGHAIDQAAWQHLSNQVEYCHVAFDDITLDGLQLIVVTYWLGLILDPHPHPSPIYRTVASAAHRPTHRAKHPDIPYDNDGASNTGVRNDVPDAMTARVRVWGWPTEDAAQAGHTAVVAWLTGTGPPPPPPLR